MKAQLHCNTGASYSSVDNSGNLPDCIADPTKNNWRKYTLHVIILLMANLLVASGAFAQASGDYQTRATGNWNAGDTWERHNGSTWVAQTAFPTISATNTSTKSVTAGTTHTVNLPASIASGDLLLIFWADAADVNTAPSTPAGWTQLYAANSGNRLFRTWYKVATGSEGSTVSITAGAERSAHNTYRIAAGSYQGVPVAGTAATGSTTTPNPSSLTSGFGTTNTLWIAAAHSAGDDNSPVPAAPANYSSLLTAYTGNDVNTQSRMTTAIRQLSAATEDPGSFTLGSSVAWGANTIAIRSVGGPSSSNGVITIRNGHTVTINASLTIDQTVVNTGGNISLTAGTLTIANGTGTDLDVSGTFTNATTTPISISPSATIAFQSGGTYEHDADGGTIPAATWNTASNCNITGLVAATTLSGADGQSFGNFTWNSTGQTANCALLSTASATTTIKGDFTYLSSGSTNRELRLINANSIVLNILGNFTFNTTFNANKFDICRSGTGSTINISGDWSHLSGTLKANNTVAVVFNKAGTQTFRRSSTNTNAIDDNSMDINFTVNSGTTLQMFDENSIVTTDLAFNLSTGATLGVTSAAGITAAVGTGTGNIRATGTRTFSTGAHYIYNGTSAQFTGTGLTQNTPANVTISNSAGVTLTASTTISGFLTLTSGLLNTGANDIFVNNSAINAVTRTTGYVNGTLRRSIATGTNSYTYDIGDASNYTPATLAFTGVTGAGAVSLTATAGLASVPGNGSLELSTANGINRYWSATSTTTGGSYTGTYTYINGAPVDNLGTFVSSELRSAIYNGSTWSYPGQVQGSSATTVTAPATADFGTIVFAAQQAVTVTPNAGQSKVFGSADPVFSYTTSPAVTLSGTLTRDPGENVGNYAITQGTVTNANNPNFLITFTSGVNFSISQLPVTVTPDAGQTKVFGAADPSFSYTTSPVVTLTGTLTRDAGENVGNYTITQGTVTNANNPNYDITFTSGVNFSISQLAVTVTPDAGQFKIYGDPNPTYTYTASPALIAPDIFTGALGRDAGESLGFYNYTLGTLTAGGNYLLSLGGSNTFEIQAVSQTNADFRSKANGNFSAAGTWEYDLGGGTWQNATQAPGIANNVSITHNVTLDQDFTVGSTRTFDLGTGAVFTVNPTRTITIAGAADFTGKPVTFKSDATGYGSLGQVTGSLNGATNVTVERYLPNNGFRSWRLLSVPTSGSQTIRQSWQENNAPLANNVPGYGTLITGGGNNTGASQAVGFDFSGPNTSMQFWNGTGWSNISGTLGALSANQAYFLYVRGDRSKTVTGLISDAGSTTLRSNGTIYTGNQSFTVPAGQFQVIPNLYPSAIDFTALTRSGISNSYTVWDSKTQYGNSLGRYVTISGITGWEPSVSSVSYPIAGAPYTTIESGQAIFVQDAPAPGSGSVTLVESAKTSASASGSLGLRPVKRATLRTSLSNEEEVLDGNVVVFDRAFSNSFDTEDAQKIGNPGANFAIETAAKILSVEGREPAKENDAVQFRMWNLHAGTYTLKLDAGNIAEAGVEAVLEDSYTKNVSPVQLNGSTTVSFTVDASSASKAANRFRLVFREGISGVEITPAISIAPNPVTGGVLNLRFSNQPEGRYSVRVMGLNGQVLLSKMVQHPGGNSNQVLSLGSRFASGNYRMEVISPDKVRSVQNLLIKN